LNRVREGRTDDGYVRVQSDARLHEPSPLKAWPDVPTRVLLCRDDRPFPAPFLRRVAEERLGITPDEIDGGHTPALSRPKDLAERLEAYRISIVRDDPDVIQHLWSDGP
jgi:pimeloyl-ACP methyl ester carboxylesterase